MLLSGGNVGLCVSESKRCAFLTECCSVCHHSMMKMMLSDGDDGRCLQIISALSSSSPAAGLALTARAGCSGSGPDGLKSEAGKL